MKTYEVTLDNMVVTPCNNEIIQNIVFYANEYIKQLSLNGYRANTVRLASFGMKKFLSFAFTTNTKLNKTSIKIVHNYHRWLCVHEGLSNSTAQKYIYIANSFANFMRSNAPEYVNLIGLAQIVPNSAPYRIASSKMSSLKTVTFEELCQLMEACNNPRDALLLCLLYETGMRISEALGIHFEDINIAMCSISIKNRGVHSNGASLKTAASARTIYCSAYLMEAISTYLECYPLLGDKSNHLFIKIRGNKRYEAMNYVDVDNLFRKLRKGTGIYVTPHILRHSSISWLYFAGWPIELISQRSGHASIQTTIGRYVHCPKDEIVKLVFNMENNIGSATMNINTDISDKYIPSRSL